jgi:hypothetical protein
MRACRPVIYLPSIYLPSIYRQSIYRQNDGLDPWYAGIRVRLLRSESGARQVSFTLPARACKSLILRAK